MTSLPVSRDNLREITYADVEVEFARSEIARVNAQTIREKSSGHPLHAIIKIIGSGNTISVALVN
jgi:hypothetical protein